MFLNLSVSFVSMFLVTLFLIFFSFAANSNEFLVSMSFAVAGEQFTISRVLAVPPR